MAKTFFAKVYSVVAQIPPGRVATYKDIAALAGNAGAARAVGMAMKHNPDQQTIPCHRVVGSDGTMHGFAFGEGIETKVHMLKQEGVTFRGDKVDLIASRWMNQ